MTRQSYYDNHGNRHCLSGVGDSVFGNNVCHWQYLNKHSNKYTVVAASRYQLFLNMSAVRKDNWLQCMMQRLESHFTKQRSE